MKLKDKFVFRPEDKKSIIEEMKMSNLPLVMWGGGSMSSSVRKILKVNSINLSACWIDGADGSMKMDDGLRILSVDAESSVISENGKGIPIKVYPLDTLLVGRTVTLVKINYLQGAYETIEGMREILKTQGPNLAITVGFDNWSLIRIPQFIKEINPDYNLHLGFLAPMPARLVLFAEK